MKIEHAYPVAFIACVAVGAVVGKMTGYGVLRGVTDGMFVAVLPVCLFLLGFLILSAWRPDLPPCRCGRCRFRDYVYVGQTGVTPTDGGVHFKCPRCGRMYEKRRNRIDELGADGSPRPYMRHSRWGRWKRAEAER